MKKLTLKDLALRKLTLILALLLFTTPKAFAHNYSDKMLRSTEISYERVVLESMPTSSNELVTNQFIFELSDWYKVHLITREVPSKELRKKFKEYKNHLAKLASKNKALKRQLIAEYKEIAKMDNVSRDEAEQIILGKLFKKHVAILQNPNATSEEKAAAAALALRVLTESYLSASSHGLKEQPPQEEFEKQKTEDLHAIKRMVFVGSMLALPLSGYFDVSDLIIKTNIFALFTSASSILAEPIVEKYKSDQFPKQEAKRLIGVFWENTQTTLKSTHPEFVLRDHLNYLQQQSGLTLESLVRKYKAFGRVVNSKKCLLALSSIHR